MEESFTLLNEFRYKKSYRAGSVTGNEVDIIGEAVYRNGADGKLYDCYLYNIVGYTPQNGKPFVSRKENIYILEPIKESREQTSVSQIAISKSKPKIKLLIKDNNKKRNLPKYKKKFYKIYQ